IREAAAAWSCDAYYRPLVTQLGRHAGRVQHAAYTPDWRWILTASEDNTARVWNAANGQLVAKLEGHSDWVLHAAFSPDGQRVVTASEHTTARLWNNADNGPLVPQLERHAGAVRHAWCSAER